MGEVGIEGLNPQVPAAESFVCQDGARPLCLAHRRKKSSSVGVRRGPQPDPRTPAPAKDNTPRPPSQECVGPAGLSWEF